MSDLILYLYENYNETEQFDGSNPNYAFFNNRLLTDPDYSALINPDFNDANHTLCMILNPLSNNENYTITINSIKIAGISVDQLLTNGDIIIRIYELPGSNPTSITYTDLNEDTMRSKYICGNITYGPASGLFNTTCNIVEEVNSSALTFNPGNSRNTYFIISVKLQRVIFESIDILKTISLDASYISPSIIPISVSSSINRASNIKKDDRYIITNNTTNIVSNVETGTGNTMGGFALSFYGSITSNTICFHELSLVHTSNGIVYAKDIKENDLVISNNGMYSVKKVVKSINCTDIIHICKNAISEDQPYSDFYVTRTHMIKVNDEELQAQELLDKYEGVRLIKLNKYCIVYSFITENGNYIKINGLDIKTFNSNELI